MPIQPDISIAIVGAGVAGLSAGQRLQEVGLHPVIFDRGRALGGRCSTRLQTPFEFDHGAQYFTVRDQVFRSQVEAWQRAGHVAPWTGRIVSWDSQRPGDAPEPTGPTERWVGVPHMRSVAEALRTGLDVRSSCPVAALQRDGIRWKLFDEAGQELGAFERVLLAMPPAQALRILPLSSPLIEVIQSIRMLPCWALMLGFEAPLPVAWDGAFCNDEVLAWAARNNSKPGRPEAESWVLHANSTWSSAHLHHSPGEIERALAAAFANRLGGVLPPAVHSQVQRWGMALPEDMGQKRVWVDRASGIGLAGDAYMGGRLEGAYSSGRLAAEALVGAADRGAGFQRTPPEDWPSD